MISIRMYESLKQSLKEFMDLHKDWTAKDYIDKEDQDMILFMNNLIDTDPNMTTILAVGKEIDIDKLLDTIATDTELSPVVIALQKNMVNNLKRREDLQMPVSLEIVRWFRRFGWRFPELEVEKS